MWSWGHPWLLHDMYRLKLNVRFCFTLYCRKQIFVPVSRSWKFLLKHFVMWLLKKMDRLLAQPSSCPSPRPQWSHLGLFLSLPFIESFTAHYNLQKGTLLSKGTTAFRYLIYNLYLSKLMFSWYWCRWLAFNRFNWSRRDIKTSSQSLFSRHVLDPPFHQE